MRAWVYKAISFRPQNTNGFFPFLYFCVSDSTTKPGPAQGADHSIYLIISSFLSVYRW